MRLSLLALAIGLALSPALTLADNVPSQALTNAMAGNPELGSYQSSSLAPPVIPAYQDPNQITLQQNAVINQAVSQITNVGDGFAVGAQAGLSSGIATKDINFTQKDTHTHSMTGPSAGIHADYGRTFSNQLYLGEEVYANLSHSNTNNYNPDEPNFNAYIGNNIGADILPGYQISPVSLIYAKLGLNLAQLSTGGVANQPDVFTNSPGVDLGIGYRQTISQNLSLALEYDWIAYNAAIYQSTSPVRFVQNLFQLSLNYQFDQMGINAGSRPALAFNSPYIGATLARKSQSVNIDNLNTTSSWGGQGFTEGLTLGYGYQFNSWFYLGTEGFLQTNQDISPQELGVSFFQESTSFGLSLLPGYILNQSNLMFGRIGSITTHFTGYNNGGAGQDLNTYRTGVELGLGYETALTQYLSLVAEYDWMLYPMIDVYANGVYNGYKDIDQVFSLGLKYRF